MNSVEQLEMIGEETIEQVNEKIGKILVNHGGYFGEGYIKNVESCVKNKRHLRDYFLDGQYEAKFNIKTPRANATEIFEQVKDFLDNKGKEHYNGIKTLISKYADSSKAEELRESDAFRSPFVDPSNLIKLCATEEEKIKLNDYIFKTSVYSTLASLNERALCGVADNSIYEFKEHHHAGIANILFNFQRAPLYVSGKQVSLMGDVNIENYRTRSEIQKIMELKDNQSPKLTKNLRPVLIEIFGLEKADFVVDVFSYIIQESKRIKSGEVEVVLSANPIDYAAVSIAENWSSCLTPDGEYAAGATSIMNDSSTLVAYVASKKTNYLVEGVFRGEDQKFHIKNKRYRMLVHAVFNTDNEIVGIVGNREYPREHTVFSELLFSIGKDKGFNFKIESDNVDFSQSEFMYNDLSNNNITIINSKFEDSTLESELGSSIYCHVCGHPMQELEFDDSEYDRKGICRHCALDAGMSDCDEDCDNCVYEGDC